jgi:hypothetical protein
MSVRENAEITVRERLGRVLGATAGIGAWSAAGLVALGLLGCGV